LCYHETYLSNVMLRLPPSCAQQQRPLVTIQHRIVFPGPLIRRVESLDA
jgi:hypothetical protein